VWKRGKISTLIILKPGDFDIMVKFYIPTNPLKKLKGGRKEDCFSKIPGKGSD